MLSGKERRQLRAQANQLKASVMIGKDGITPKVKNFINEAFNNKFLVKVKVLNSCEDNRKQIAEKLKQLKEPEVIQLLGRTILLYRPLKEDKTT